MDLITPGIGLIFWTTLVFLILLLVLTKYAWPAIHSAISVRNDNIRKALEAADKAREEMKKLQADNEKIMAEARKERDALIKEAREIKEALIAEAREKASEEAKNMIGEARKFIQAEKESAINEMKKQMAILSVDIAEKLIRMKMGDDTAQKDLLNKLIDEIDLN
ncbi:MAG: F0F1 ATP synthase subunit B [Bacteroidales bacterium]|nr:F0F1 ATP synthase subunit B [Bacteroidales bacterium]MBN2699779.1 F0F1 ATP synthase subunit B [Bacteroidales bacterium]